MGNAGLDESTSWNQYYWEKYQYADDTADDTTLMAESQEELKSLLNKVKEEREKAGLKLNIQKTKIMASSPITANRRGENGNSDILYFLGLQNHC